MSTTSAKKTTKPKTTTKEAASKAPAAKAKAAIAAKSAAGAGPKPVPPSPVSGVSGANPPSAKVAKPAVVDGPQPVILGPVMRKKELIDTVVTRAGVKKRDAKPVVEAMLAVLGDALADNRELILPPFGRVMVRKEKQLPNGRMMIIKVRQSTAPKAAKPEDTPE